jgi:hypothetical protein
MLDRPGYDGFQPGFAEQHFVAATRFVGFQQVDVPVGVRANLLPARHPLADFGLVHQQRLRDADVLVPDIGFAQQAADRIAGGRKAVFHQTGKACVRLLR